MPRYFLFLALLFNLIAFSYLYFYRTPAKLYPVVRIIDGDTFIVADTGSSLPEQTVRLLSVNAPEPALCGGPEAKTQLETLLQNNKVRLVSNTKDHYGRILALVYIGNTLINEQIIRSGYARFTSSASPESERLKLAFNQTKAKKIGIYGSLCTQAVNPLDPACNIKGNVRDGRKLYFYPGCGNYSNVLVEKDQGDQWFCTAPDALAAGFAQAENCY